MKLSILICTIPSREDSCLKLMDELYRQIEDLNVYDKVEILSWDEKEVSIGEKRNELLTTATGEYVCFIDDDDTVSKDYVSKILQALTYNPDCCSLIGVLTTDGNNPEIFEHSIIYNQYKTNDHYSAVKYERYPNHLNVIRASIAKRFKFPETNFGEDTDWATQIHKSGLLKTEMTIPGVIYHYQYISKK